jgi:SAM-dependent methyltransferase
MEPFNKALLDNPHWTLRNKTIAETINPNKSILDLGCGSKDFLKYYQPSNYLGVDIVPSADIIMNLNNNINVEGNWDYVINSGILEYVNDPEQYIQKIKTLGKEYIFTWYQGQGLGRPSNDIIKDIIETNYMITRELNWGSQKIYLCQPIQNSV